MRGKLTCALIVVAVCAPAALAAGGESRGIARCEQAIIGHGPGDWRSDHLVAGPVGVMRHPLARMSETKKGWVTKMPLLVEGREPETVTVSVPRALRRRVFLYFGGGASFFARDRGYAEVEFQLCGNKPRTIWPGGIRVKGAEPVRLEVFVAGRDEPYLLRLGRPQAYEPPS